jgi:hypothetical protein
MELKNKIIAGVALLGIAGGVTVMELDKVCVFDAEVLQVQEQKMCFSKAEDYKIFKDSLISQYEKKASGLFLWTDEGAQFLSVVNHELDKMGKLRLRSFSKNTDVIGETLKLIK